MRFRCAFTVRHSTHERMVGFPFEHYAGNFPVWLSHQARVTSITDNQTSMPKISREAKLHEMASALMLISPPASAMNAKIR